MEESQLDILVTITNAGLTPDQQQLLLAQLQTAILALLPGRTAEQIIARERLGGQDED